MATNESITAEFTLNPPNTDTLTAVAAPGSQFTGWSSGGCSGTGTCKVTVSSAIGVTANFAPMRPSCSLRVVSSKIALRKSRKSPHVDTLAIAVKCTQAVGARVTGTLTEKLSRKHSKRFKLGPITANVAAGVSHTIDIKLSGSAIEGLKQKRKESVALTLRASNANGGGGGARAAAGKLRGSG